MILRSGAAQIIMEPRLHIETALRMIPEFDGKREEFHKFVSVCDMISSDMSAAADAPMLLNLIKTKLSGQAYNIIKYKNFRNWNELKTILQEQFLERRTVAQLQIELLAIKQNFNEDIRSYSNRLERSLSDLHDACVVAEGAAAAEIIHKLNEKCALKAFVNGLLDPLNLIIKAYRFDKLSDAIEAAVEEERNIPKRKVFNKNHNATINSPKCSFCHKTGHIFANCYSRKSSVSLPNFPPRPEIKREPTTPIRTVTITCSYCKNIGHHIKDCRKRQYNENKKREQNNYVHDSKNASQPGPSGGCRASNLK